MIRHNVLSAGFDGMVKQVDVEKLWSNSSSIMFGLDGTDAGAGAGAGAGATATFGPENALGDEGCALPVA